MAPAEASGREQPDERAARVFESEFLRSFGPIPPLKVCPIGWQPSALTPVFYGYRDYSNRFVNAPPDTSEAHDYAAGEVRPAPANTRVFFPSLDGSPQNAAILQGCGLYPLILFVHGNCNDDERHYLRWYELPARLARAGYVVAVPQMEGIDEGLFPPEDAATQATLSKLLSWMREEWQYQQTLMPAPATGLVGHSYGGMHAGMLATKIAVAGVVSLSGIWGQWLPAYGPNPITQLQVPQLLTWGTGITEAFAAAILPDSLWDEAAAPKHRAVFARGEHFDYLYDATIPCRGGQGSCPWEGPAAFDLTTMFFGRYLPPQLWPNLPDMIPATLLPPPLELTPAQQFYAGGYLNGLSGFEGDEQCSVQISEVVGDTVTVPYVLYMPATVAAHLVEQRDLVPIFIGASGAGAWVRSQSPSVGTPVAAGTQVEMLLATGTVP